MDETQTLLSEIIPTLTLEPLNLPISPVLSYDIPVQQSVPFSNTDDIESIVSSTKKFSEEQQNVFKVTLGKSFPEVTAGNPEAAVQRPFSHYSQRLGAYF